MFETIQDSWEDVEDEKKDVEKAADVPKSKPKTKKTLSEKIEEREVRQKHFSRVGNGWKFAFPYCREKLARKLKKGKRRKKRPWPRRRKGRNCWDDKGYKKRPTCDWQWKLSVCQTLLILAPESPRKARKNSIPVFNNDKRKFYPQNLFNALRHIFI